MYIRSKRYKVYERLRIKSDGREWNQSNVNKHLLVLIVMARVGSVRSESEQMQSFAEGLEQRARDAISSDSSSWEVEGFSASAILKDQMALTLHQIGGLQDRRKKTDQSLLQEECEINTELMQMEQRTPPYSPYRFPEREKLQRRRGRVLEQGRRFMISHAEKLDALHDRLLSLLSRHRQISA